MVARVKSRDSAVKRVLLDQTVASGIGNIYADEALWRAGVHGERVASTLTKPRIGILLDHAADVMREALDQGGTSFDALYVNVNGASGYFDRSLAAYGQVGRPCRRCGDCDPARGVHEPLVVQLPAVPAPTPGQGIGSSSSVTFCPVCCSESLARAARTVLA